MNRSDASSRNNNSINFTFEQSGIRNQPQGYARRDTLDDLRYSVDSNSQSSISRQYNIQESKMQNVLPYNQPLIIENPQQERKRQRKAIFQKNTPRNLGVVNNGIGLIQKEVANKVRENENVATKRNQIFSNLRQRNPQIPPQPQSNGNRMNPPPHLPRHISQAPLHQQLKPTTAPIFQNRLSNNSVGSVVINDHNSLIINDNNNPYGRSRQSREMSGVFEVDRYGSFNEADISLIRQDQELNVSRSSVQSIRSTLLDQMRLSQNANQLVIINGSKTENQNVNMNVNTNQPIIAQEISTVGSKINSNPNPTSNSNLNISKGNEQSFILQFSPNTSKINMSQQMIESNYMDQLHQSAIQIPGSLPNQSFLKKDNTNVVVLEKSNIIGSDQNQIPKDIANSINHPSNLSIHSLRSDMDFNSLNNSSALLSSQSMNKALGNLSQYVFIQPTIQSRIPELLQQCWRLNSISINLLSPKFSLDSIRHKETIRNQIFQSLLATQALQRFKDEIQNRQIKQKKILKYFNTNSFIQGEWYEVNTIKNCHLMKPKQVYTKRPVNYQTIKQTLRNSTQVLKYYQGFIQHFRIESTKQFRQRYIQLRTSLFQIFNNLKKISQDLYMKSINVYIPQLYFKIYQYLKFSSTIKSQSMNAIQIHAKIQDKDQILKQLQNYKRQKDPLANSELVLTVQTKIKNQLDGLKGLLNIKQ